MPCPYACNRHRGRDDSGLCFFARFPAPKQIPQSLEQALEAGHALLKIGNARAYFAYFRAEFVAQVILPVCNERGNRNGGQHDGGDCDPELVVFQYLLLRRIVLRQCRKRLEDVAELLP